MTDQTQNRHCYRGLTGKILHLDGGAHAGRW